MSVKFASGLFLIFSITLQSGCGPKIEAPPKTVPVTGTVIYKSKPVEGAIVTFVIDGSPRTASGTTNANGEFQLSTFQQNDGAVVGTHRVTVVKLDPELQQRPDEDANAYTTRVLGKDPGKSLLPADYSIPGKTPLKAEVKDPGPNTITLELKG